MFRSACDNSPPHSIRVSGLTVTECASEMHLGHRLSSAGLDQGIVSDAVGKFWSYYNSLTSDFSSTHPVTQCNLFKSYCCCFYGSPLWDLEGHLESIATAWRRALKMLWGVPRETNREIVAMLSGCLPIQLSLYKRRCKFVKAALNGPNVITATVMNISMLNPLSSFRKNMNILTYLFDIDINTMHRQVPDFKPSWLLATESLNDTVSALRELLIAKFNDDVDRGFDEEDVDDLVHMLAAG